MGRLEEFDLGSWEGVVPAEVQKAAMSALEAGKVVFLPKLSYSLDTKESAFLTPTIADPKSKNISYDMKRDHLAGAFCEEELKKDVKRMLQKYALKSRHLMHTLFPSYNANLVQGRTSFRPAEISGRKSSYKKDDTRLHVDAFPATPVKGKRILRVFTNVNPEGKPRVWRVGEPFEDVVKKMSIRLQRPIPGLAALLRMLKITKEYRTLYDHYMLQLHDNMKKDLCYQQEAPQEEIHFPAGSSWIVFTDQVSHAAMSGQYVFEQTYYLPIVGQQDEKTSPQRILERHFNKALC